jgi:hypothetical protein
MIKPQIVHTSLLPTRGSAYQLHIVRQAPSAVHAPFSHLPSCAPCPPPVSRYDQELRKTVDVMEAHDLGYGLYRLVIRIAQTGLLGATLLVGTPCLLLCFWPLCIVCLGTKSRGVFDLCLRATSVSLTHVSA